MHIRDVRFLASVDFCDFHNCLPIWFMILCCNYYYPALQFHATWNFHSEFQSFPSVRRSTVAAAQLCHASPTTSCGQGRVKQPEKHESPPEWQSQCRLITKNNFSKRKEVFEANAREGVPMWMSGLPTAGLTVDLPGWPAVHPVINSTRSQAQSGKCK